MLDKKINTLLFTHDCVIVPGLGGFVASQTTARHNTVQHTFIPPARIIAFNVFLRQNDGLLANFISSEEKISFIDALKIIERYVERCFMELEAGKKITVANIGQLYYDSEKNIQFNPDEDASHSFDSFGLTSLRAVPLAMESRKENIFFSPLRSSALKEKKHKTGQLRKTGSIHTGNRFVNAGLVVGVLLWAMFNVYIIAPGNFNFSALNPFEKSVSERIRPVPLDTVKAEEPAAKNIPLPAPTIQPANNETIMSVTEEKIPVETSAKKANEENIPPAPINEKASDVTGHYFSVVGVFNVKSNAEKMLQQLRENGYQNPGSIERENKPTMVYAGQYLQKTDAAQSIQRLKEQGIDAWVFAR